MNDMRKKLFGIMCEGALIAYTEEQEKIFEILAGKPLSTVSKKDLQNYKKNAKLWEILTNIRNQDLSLNKDGTVDMTNYKKLNVEKHINNQIDDILQVTFLMKLNNAAGNILNPLEMLVEHSPEESYL